MAGKGETDDVTTRNILVGALAGAMLAGCAVKPPPPPEIARVAPPPLVAPPRPQASARVAETFRTPPRDSYGKYQTPNGNLSSEEALWHLRMGLNVAALSCYDDTDSVNAAYGNFLTLHQSRLAAANTAMDRLWVERAGKSEAKAARDNHSVEVYNFFALPMVTPSLCATAAKVLATANATPSDQLEGYASVGLAELEGPFIAFFDSYDQYRVAAAEWDQLYGAPQPVQYGASVSNPATTVYSTGEVTYDPTTNQPVIETPVNGTAPTQPPAAPGR